MAKFPFLRLNRANLFIIGMLVITGNLGSASYIKALEGYPDDSETCQYLDYSDLDRAMRSWRGLPLSRDMFCKIYFEDNDDDITNDIMVDERSEELVSLLAENNPRIKHISDFDSSYKKLAQYHMVRKQVYARVKNMLAYLPKEVGIAFISGFKPIIEAKREFDQEMRRQLEMRRYDYDIDDTYEKASKHVMPFLYNRGIATGAYVEMTLFIKKANSAPQLLDLGSLQASLGKRSQASYRSDYIFTENLSPEQKKNRFTLLKAALSAGLVAQAGNFRYFSYGDKVWAYVKQKDYALYGVVGAQDDNITNMRKDQYLRGFARQQGRDNYRDNYDDDYYNRRENRRDRN